jgi:hypothetical protein
MNSPGCCVACVRAWVEMELRHDRTTRDHPGLTTCRVSGAHHCYGREQVRRRLSMGFRGQGIGRGVLNGVVGGGVEPTLFGERVTR